MFIFFRYDSEKAGIALLVGATSFGLVNFFISWILSLVLAAFGELCENVYELNKKINKYACYEKTNISTNEETKDFSEIDIEIDNDDDDDE